MGLLDRYNSWVRNNAAAVMAAEGALSSLTWLVPDRFSDSELALEALNSALGLLSMYHGRILGSPDGGDADAKYFEGLPWPLWLGALHQVEVLVEMGANSLERRGRVNKYTPLALLELLKAALRLLLLYRVAGGGGRILANGGLLADPAHGGSAAAATPQARAQAVYSAFARFRERHSLPRVPQYDQAHARQRAAAGAEAADAHEACARARRAAAAGEALPPTPRAAAPRFWWDMPPLPRVPPGAAAAAAAAASAAGDGGGASVAAGVDAGAAKKQAKALNGDCDGCASPGSTDRQRLLARVEARAAARQAMGLQLLAAGELWYTLRPLLYVLSLRRWGRSSWRPWALSLAVDLAAAQLLAWGARVQRAAAAEAAAEPALAFGSISLLYSLQAHRWTPLEQRELARRKVQLLLYALRSPFFNRYTRPAVEGAQARLRLVPLLGSLVGKAAEILFGVTQYYTYTSAS
ncbi:hypothetical protein WJX81_000511 [Elliptochloris bilobata]|uniref:Peroxisomal membrane protein PEX16 n=1 Tax=Elliptochloris bilobata TaxID=381761 RepID=A0AAW1QI63_9CHLO